MADIDKIKFITLSDNNKVITFYDENMKYIPTISHSYTPIGNNVCPYIINPNGVMASTIATTERGCWGNIYQPSNHLLSLNGTFGK
jgi:hypothetical protein